VLFYKNCENASKFQDLTPISGHFRTNFKISGISGQRPGLKLRCLQKKN